jgi:hypothetical protein
MARAHARPWPAQALPSRDRNQSSGRGHGSAFARSYWNTVGRSRQRDSSGPQTPETWRAAQMHGPDSTAAGFRSHDAKAEARCTVRSRRTHKPPETWIRAERGSRLPVRDARGGRRARCSRCPLRNFLARSTARYRAPRVQESRWRRVRHLVGYGRRADEPRLRPARVAPTRFALRLTVAYLQTARERRRTLASPHAEAPQSGRLSVDAHARGRRWSRAHRLADSRLKSRRA